MKYRNIVFLQNSQDFDNFVSKQGFGSGSEGFFNSTEKEMIEYLSQWDYGDGEISNISPSGMSDYIYDNGMFRLSYDPRLGYAGLSELINE